MAADGVLYNRDRADDYPVGLVVPSPDWVWRVGAGAVAPLGNPDPRRLARRLRSAFGDKPVVLVSVEGAGGVFAEGADAVRQELTGPLAHVVVPRETRTAARRDVRRLIESPAVAGGVKVSFRSSRSITGE